ncbi:MAG: glycosyltransferase family 2 protein [Halobacteriales archaeon]
MDLSVVVPTLNGRDRLASAIDALGALQPAAEVIVVNGPSTDGTTGMVLDRDDVDVLIELADRNVNAARNAGIGAATGDVIAIVDERSVITDGWLAGLTEAFEDGADAVTGPVHRRLRVGMETSAPERRQVAGHDVTYIDGGNVAFTRTALETVDGFDEYLEIGGARDLSHRLAITDFDVVWASQVVVERERSAADGGHTDWGWKYRSLAYRLVKNYGLRPRVLLRTLRHAIGDGIESLRTVLDGEGLPSEWLGDGRDVVTNTVRGSRDGLRARLQDPDRHNPHGLSARDDRAVKRYDWR